MLICAVGSQAITLRGTVTNASTNAAVVGAVVSLTMGANVFMDTTITGGTYELITRNNTTTTGLLLVTAAGYNNNNQLVTGLNIVDTVNVALTPTGGPTPGTKRIVGTVTIASGTNAGNAVDSARLILSTGAGNVLDTVRSGANGKYVFDSLSAGTYDIVTSKLGYTQNTVALRLTAGMDSIISNIQLTPVATGTLTGKVVKAADTASGIAAKVVLTRTVTIGGVVTTTRIDSATAAASGVYTLDNIPVNTGYRLLVMATGYAEAQSPNTFTLVTNQTRTENFRLLAVIPPSGIVNGAVTNSVDDNAVGQATVVLRRLNNVTYTPIDTTSTLANGSFAFTGLAIGTYSIVVSKTDYTTYTTPVNRALNLTTNPDTATVAVSLVPVPKGNLIVFVHDNVNVAVPGASVSAVQAVLGQTYNGMTATNGYVKFASVSTGSYNLTISAAGYNTQISAGNTVSANANDTVRITLAAATGAAKVVKGTVKNAAGTGIGSAVVILTARLNANVLTLVDTCGSNGTYLIAGIPVGYTTASLSVSKASYLTKDTSAISIANDTTTVNVTLAGIVGVSVARSHAKTGLSFMQSRNGIYVQMGDANIPARVMLYSTNGRLVLSRTVSQSGSALLIPKKWSNQVMLLTIQQGNTILRQKVTIR
jgi:hypothetical protein